MGRRPRGRDVQGILLLDKPLGVTSNKALQRVKQIFFARKAGHTGSLDPEAGGLLPICFGGATKVSAYLLDADKRYWVRVRLGETTTTADAEGELLRTRPVEGVTEALLGDALARFRGEIQQIPPMYSALKHQGERLYKLAREGVEVERKPRTITIYELKLLAWESPHLELEVRCSKGTYIRTLAEDIGEVLGCGAHVAALRRTGLGPYREADMVTMERIEAAAREGNEALDALLLGVDSAFYLGQGQAVLVPNAPTGGPVRIYDPNGRFLGIGEILDDGRVAPRRMI
ncbi:MAG: tRNA pseudouridine(55) synthase TruB [Candidatus Sedimenticola endophacoides]|nr:MAG: tRNA pseudouridine(55) synthase TruB [Candidatus Sedimenticola endophacoides]